MTACVPIEPSATDFPASLHRHARAAGAPARVWLAVGLGLLWAITIPAAVWAQAAPDWPARDVARAWADATGAKAPPNERLDSGLAVAQLEAARAAGDGRRLRERLARFLPAARVDDAQRILVDLAAADDPARLAAALGRHSARGASFHGRMASAWVPIAALDALGREPAVGLLRPAYSIRHVGRATSQGDTALATASARTAGAVDGTGVTVGVLSDSYNCLGGAAADIASLDLPAGLTLVKELSPCTGATDEGRAMLQIVHDLAPGSPLAFHTASLGTADFANGIRALARNYGARVVVDDVIYFAEPMFQDGPIAQAVDDVVSTGTAYFSAAGNAAAQSYEAPFRDSGQRGYYSGSRRHDFDPGSGVTTLQNVTIAQGATVYIVLQWDQPFQSVSGGSGSATDLDIFLFDTNGTLVASSATRNIGGDPVEILQFKNATAGTAFRLAIDRASGSASPALLKYVYFGTNLSEAFATGSPTLYGHANAKGARAVAAAYYRNTPAYGVVPAAAESYTSLGGVAVLFTTTGARVTDARPKPEIAAADGVDNTFFGSDTDGTGLPNFFGTSAAAPHAAGVAALLLQATPTATSQQVYAAIENSALDMGAAGFDALTGAGLMQAPAALDAIRPALPGVVGFGATPDGAPIQSSFAGTAFSSQGVSFAVSGRADGLVGVGAGPSTVSSSGFAGNTVLADGAGATASVTLTFATPINTLGFAYATASGRVDVELRAPGGALIATPRLTGSESLSFAGAARLGGRASLSGYGSIGQAIIRSVAPDQDLRLDSLGFGNTVQAAPGNAAGDAPLPPWAIALLAGMIVATARRRHRRGVPDL